MDAAAQLRHALGGRYDIDRQIGRGGMATVFLARDVRHHRNVALKVLDPELGAVLGGERFLAEIQVTANLQHPNLLPLFDSGEADGLLFYVMPYVEGESLRGRLEREKQLPIDDALHITTAVCGALEHAHRRGVVHRDLKPENILLHEGQPLIADFGIALAVSVAGGSRVTQTGISLGTPQYMSPEQATGDRAVDGRSDVYSLGCVLYEMLTGEPPHIGSTVQSIIAKVLTDKPQSVRVLRDTVPEHVDLALQKALAKLPADRWATAAQFADALNGRAATLASVAAASGAASSRARWMVPALIAAGAAVVGLSAAVVALTTGDPAPELPARFDIALPQNLVLDNIYRPLNISPDGRHIVFRAAAGGSVMLARRSLDDMAVRLIAGTENGGWPFVSPDNRWIAFLSGEQLRKVPIDGGPTVGIGTIPGSAVQGASWAPGNVIVLGAFQGSAGLSVVPAAGGTPRPLTRIDPTADEISHRMPVALADGETVLFTSWPQRGVDGSRIGIASLRTGEFRVLDLPGTHPIDIVDGHLIYVRTDGTLMAVPVDRRRRTVTGEPVALVEGINMNRSVGAARVALGGSTLVYLAGGQVARLSIVDTLGVTRPIGVEPGSFTFPAWSPDGRSIALTVGGSSAGGGDIWILELASHALRRLTYEGGVIPMWSRDGRRVIFLRRINGRGTVWQRVADASAPEEKLFEAPVDIAEAELAPDGYTLLYRTAVADAAATQRDVFMVDLRDGRPKPVLSSRFNETEPRLSRDGRWLAYQSDETGTFQVYVRPFPGPGAVVQVSVDGGVEPVWSRDGRRLFYRRGLDVIAANVAADSQFRVASRRTLFSGSFFGIAMSHPSYDVSPDGREFVVLRTDESGQLTVVLNWLTELRQRIGK